MNSTNIDVILKSGMITGSQMQLRLQCSSKLIAFLAIFWGGSFADISCFAQGTLNIDSIKYVISTSKDDATVILMKIMLADHIFYSDPDSALSLFLEAEQRALKIISNPNTTDSLRSKFNSYLAFAYFDLGSIYHQRNDINTAMKYYSMSLRIYEKKNRKYGIAGVLNSIGLIYMGDLNDFRRAMENYSKALQLYREIQDTANVAIILSNIGVAFQKNREKEKAIEYFNQSMLLHKQTNNIQGMAEIASHFAKLYQDEGQDDKAIFEAKKSLNLYETAADMEGSVQTRLLLANLWLNSGKIQESEKLAYDALTIGRKNNYRKRVMEAANLLQKIYKSAGKHREQVHMLELYIQMRDSTENREMQLKAIRDLITLENSAKTLDDSIKNMMAQRVKDEKIHLQQIMIERQQKSRTIIIAGTLSLLLIALISFMLYRRRLRQKENELIINSLETEQQLLRAQMNPHFIFNSLNSIQSLILKNELSLAREYLIVFSKLTRGILEQTRVKSVSLAKEIETLTLYLNMEKLRFQSRFDYEFQVDKNISPESLMIPPLLIQPFVENCIQHGMFHKPAQGNIHIQFENKDGYLLCTVTDNGIGRVKSAEINKQRYQKRKSIATQLARDRLKLIHPDGEDTDVLLITDLTDKDGNPSGTKVEIKLKIMNDDTSGNN